MTDRGNITGSREWQQWDEQQPILEEIPCPEHHESEDRIPPNTAALRAQATERADFTIEVAMIEVAKLYGAAQTARETWLLDRLRSELISAITEGLVWRHDTRTGGSRSTLHTKG